METVNKTGSGQEREPFILFEVAGTTYGIRSRYVLQMEMIEDITPVPNTLPFIDGVMFSRGEAIPVINLRLRFGLEKIPYDVKTRVIVVKIGDRTIGLIADSAREYVNLSSVSVQPLPEFITGQNVHLLGGVINTGDRTILIFNVEEVINSEKETMTLQKE